MPEEIELRALITGGAGFIGSHLVEALLRRGFSVIILDDLSTGSIENISHLCSDSRVEFVEHDVTKNDPIRTMKTNVIGTLNVCALALRVNARLLLASTSEIYGDPLVHPQSEAYCGNVDPVGPRSCYDEGKRAAETVCMDFHRTHGLPVRIARIFNTYGPRMALNDGRVVSNLIIQALQTDALSLYGDGSQTRSFCYVDDMVEGLIAFMFSDHTGPVNIGNPEEFTVKELAIKISSLIGIPSPQFEYRSLPKDDPVRRRPDITRARNLLSWSPKVCLEEGLVRTISDIKIRLEKNGNFVQVPHQRDAILTFNS